jgi:hypothetical protein
MRDRRLLSRRQRRICIDGVDGAALSYGDCSAIPTGAQPGERPDGSAGNAWDASSVGGF